MALKLSEFIERLQELQELGGDPEVRTADWEFVKSRELEEREQNIQFVESEDSKFAMLCDDLNDDPPTYPYILIGAI